MRIEASVGGGIVLVYHGTNCIIDTPEIRVGKFTKDFGEGFYCTVIKEQAVRWAAKYKTPVVNSYKCNIDERLSILEFKEMTEEWLDFIIDCRAGKLHTYDIVIGAMADDQIYNYINEYLNGNITRSQFWVMTKFRYPTHQINFCTKDGLKCLKYVQSEVQ